MKLRTEMMEMEWGSKEKKFSFQRDEGKFVIAYPREIFAINFPITIGSSCHRRQRPALHCKCGDGN